LEDDTTDGQSDQNENIHHLIVVSRETGTMHKDAESSSDVTSTRETSSKDNDNVVNLQGNDTTNDTSNEENNEGKVHFNSEVSEETKSDETEKHEAEGKDRAVIAEIEDRTTDNTSDQRVQNKSQMSTRARGILNTISGRGSSDETNQEDDGLEILETEQEVKSSDSNKTNSGDIQFSCGKARSVNYCQRFRGFSLFKEGSRGKGQEGEQEEDGGFVHLIRRSLNSGNLIIKLIIISYKCK